MPRGYRYGIAAVIGCLIVAFEIGWGLQPEQPHLTGDDSYIEQSASYHAGGAQCEPAALGHLTGRKAKSEASRCDEAEEQHREATDSLIEARRSADAADASTVAAYQQTRIAGWGAGLSFVTMFAAIAAAIFAERAAYHTKRSANSTDLALAEQFRARLVVTPAEVNRVEIRDNKIHIGVSFCIENTGTVSAYRVGYIFDLIPYSTNGSRRVDPESEEFSLVFGVFGHNDLKPGRSTIRGFTDNKSFIELLPNANSPDPIESVFYVTLLGCVSYFSGPSEKPKHTYFTWYVRETESVAGFVAQAIKDGYQGHLDVKHFQVGAERFGYREE